MEFVLPSLIFKLIKHIIMKKLFLLLTMVGLIAISCDGVLDDEENGGVKTSMKSFFV